MRKKLPIIVVAAAVLGAVAYGLREYTRGHADVAGMKAAYALEADALLAEFLADEAAARAKYVGEAEQAIEVRGVVAEVEPGADGGANVRLEAGDGMAGVVCEFAAADLPQDWQAGDAVRIRGICQGYTGEGMMPGDVVLQRCVPAP